MPSVRRPLRALCVCLVRPGAVLLPWPGLRVCRQPSSAPRLPSGERAFAEVPAGSAIPYAALGLLCLGYFLRPPPAVENVATNPDWPGLLNGVNHLLFFPMGLPTADWIYAPLVPPPAPGCPGCWVAASIGATDQRVLFRRGPVPVVVAGNLHGTFFVVPRFAVFLLPFYALAIFPPGRRGRASHQGMLGLAALCWAFVAIQAERLIAFAREPIVRRVLAAADPRLSGATAGPGCRQRRAAWTPMAYTNFPLWYQAEKSGLVDFQLAQFAAQIVRYRDPKAEAGKPASAYRYSLPSAAFARCRRPSSLPARVSRCSGRARGLVAVRERELP